jgi:hypothetical protein
MDDHVFLIKYTVNEVIEILQTEIPKIQNEIDEIQQRVEKSKTEKNELISSFNTRKKLFVNNNSELVTLKQEKEENQKKLNEWQLIKKTDEDLRQAAHEKLLELTEAQEKLETTRQSLFESVSRSTLDPKNEIYKQEHQSNYKLWEDAVEKVGYLESEHKKLHDKYFRYEFNVEDPDVKIKELVSAQKELETKIAKPEKLLKDLQSLNKKEKEKRQQLENIIQKLSNEIAEKQTLKDKYIRIMTLSNEYLSGLNKLDEEPNTKRVKVSEEVATKSAGEGTKIISQAKEITIITNPQLETENPSQSFIRIPTQTILCPVTLPPIAVAGFIPPREHNPPLLSTTKVEKNHNSRPSTVGTFTCCDNERSAVRTRRSERSRKVTPKFQEFLSSKEW